MKKFIFWLYHVVLKNDILCSQFCPTCPSWSECHSDVTIDV